MTAAVRGLLSQHATPYHTARLRCMGLVTLKSEEPAHCGAPKEAPDAFGKRMVSAGSLYGT